MRPARSCDRGLRMTVPQDLSRPDQLMRARSVSALPLLSEYISSETSSGLEPGGPGLFSSKSAYAQLKTFRTKGESEDIFSPSSFVKGEGLQGTDAAELRDKKDRAPGRYYAV